MEKFLKIWVVIISFITHNDARVEIGVKPLKWDPQLASHAHEFVKKYIFDCKKGVYDVTSVDAVNGWLTQKTNYDYKFNSCIDGTHNCVLYAQIVWGAATSLGCARIQCRNYGGILITCFDYPSSHFPGQNPFVIH
ncbi:hypothetical protein HN51_030511 [Arachis hypogaea]|uniref:SCP domain-containing protein n=1 Tax=Arachis hypogaea TaxID=3818 RepID=A0A445BB12_ARAHY|nr:hypothetical protein Ahy_A10g050941 [Arachis hypogaea]